MKLKHYKNKLGQSQVKIADSLYQHTKKTFTVSCLKAEFCINNNRLYEMQTPGRVYHKLSVAERLKISEGSKGLPKPKPQTLEYKLKMSEIAKGVPKPKPQTQEYKQKMSQLLQNQWQENPKLQNYKKYARQKRLNEALQELGMPFEEAKEYLAVIQQKIDVWLEAYEDIFGEEPSPKEIRKTNPSMYRMILDCGDLEKKVARVQAKLEKLQQNELMHSQQLQFGINKQTDD